MTSPSYPFSIYLQPPGTTLVEDRVDVTTDAKYFTMMKLTNSALHHAISSPLALTYTLGILFTTFSHVQEAQDSFRDLHGKEAVPTKEFLLEYLTTTPPDIVIGEMDEKDDELVWGFVTKGTEPLADRNEVWVSLELATALLKDRGDPELHHSPETTAFLQTSHRLLWSVTYLHELQHTINKYMFSSRLTTPSMVTPGTSDGHGNGEAGDHFEKKYIGFLLVVEVAKDDANKKGVRLWKILSMLAEKDTKFYDLDRKTLQDLLDSFETNKVQITFQTAPQHPVTQPNHVRWRVRRGDETMPPPPDSRPSGRGRGRELIGLGLQLQNCTIRF